MAWKPLPLFSERNNTAPVTAVMYVTEKDSVTGNFFSNHNIEGLAHDCLKISQLSGH